MKTYLALEDDKLTSGIGGLQAVLANTLYMYQLYKKYHWHVAGEDFYQYHKLFDKHADEQLPIIDAVAERLRTLGADAEGMPADVVKNATVTEQTNAGNNPKAMVQSLLQAHEQYITQLRSAIAESNKAEDEGTSDLLVSEILRVHELEVWFLRSSLSA